MLTLSILGFVNTVCLLIHSLLLRKLENKFDAKIGRLEARIAELEAR